MMLFQVSEGVVMRAEVGEFKLSGHREADTMMVHFASCLSATKDAIVVRADDTDVFILLLHHQLHMSTGTTIFMDMGLSSKNNRRCYNMHVRDCNLTWPKGNFSSLFKSILQQVPSNLLHKETEMEDEMSVHLASHADLSHMCSAFFCFQICAALPAFHAFTGCDYTAAFSRCSFYPFFPLIVIASIVYTLLSIVSIVRDFGALSD